MGLSSVIGKLLASGHPEESWQPTTLSSSIFYGQNIKFTVPEAGAISEDRWPPHPHTQHPLQDTKNSWKMTWSARRGIHTLPMFKSGVTQTCRQQTKHSKCFIVNNMFRSQLPLMSCLFYSSFLSTILRVFIFKLYFICWNLLTHLPTLSLINSLTHWLTHSLIPAYVQFYVTPTLSMSLYRKCTDYGWHTRWLLNTTVAHCVCPYQWIFISNEVT